MLLFAQIKQIIANIKQWNNYSSSVYLPGLAQKYAALLVA